MTTDIFLNCVCKLCHRPYSVCLEDKCDGRALVETALEQRKAESL